MEKRCIQCICNLMNSDTILFDRIVKHSLSMSSTTLGANIRYFMFKYGIYMSEWYGPLSVLYCYSTYCMFHSAENIYIISIAIKSKLVA